MLCDIEQQTRQVADDFPAPRRDQVPAGEQSIVLAGGCFWCVEAVYRRLRGVLDVESGYAGGTAETADYRSVCSGSTDHAEVVRIRFDSEQCSLGQILKIFFAVAHDPTQLNRQGNDRGRQYRSAVFYADAEQQELARDYIEQLNQSAVFDKPIVTALEPLEAFYPAEGYHQNYAALNPGQPYIQAVAQPKVAKLEARYKEQLKS